MQYLRLRRQVRTLLADLGHTSDEVAATLRDSGVLGTPKDVHGCAIARYLNAILGSETCVQSVGVGQTRVRLVIGRTKLPLSVALPEPAQAFVRSFDKFLYPGLVRTNQGSRSRGSPKAEAWPKAKDA